MGNGGSRARGARTTRRGCDRGAGAPGEPRCGGPGRREHAPDPDGPGTAVAVEEEVQEVIAPLSRVVCHDDPHTTMEFVVQVFTGVFRLPHPRAVEVMLEVHERGAAVVGHYPRSVAERKVKKATTMARTSGFPLTFSIEED